MTIKQSSVNMKSHSNNRDEQFGPFTPLEAELLNELNERAEILMSENALMVEQKSVLLTELEGFQAELSNYHRESSELKKQNQSLQKDLNQTRQRMKQAESDRDESSRKILKYSEALGKVESEMDDLKDQLSVWQQKGDVADANMAEARRQLKAMRAKMEEDGVVYMRRMKVAEDRVKELHNQLLQVRS